MMGRMITVGAVLVAVIACALALQANAAPSVGGYTGLIVVPTGEVLGRSEYNVAFFNLSVEEGNDTWVFASNLGAAKSLEAGFARYKPDDGEGETLLNAKYQVRPVEGGKPALAVGVIDATDEVDATAYFVVTQPLLKPAQVGRKVLFSPVLHVGVGGGMLDGLFAGFSAVLGDRLTLIAEYDSNDVNLGARLALGSGFRVHAGWTNDLNDVALGVSFNKSY